MLSITHRFFVSIFALSSFAFTSWAKPSEALMLKVDPNFERYLPLLESPEVFAFAIENSGIRISHNGRIFAPKPGTLTLRRDNSYPFKIASVSFIERQNQFYQYQIEIDWAHLPVKLAFRANIDVSEIKKQGLKVQILSSVGTALPSGWKRYAEDRLNSLLQPDFQSRLLIYLDTLKLKSAQPGVNAFTSTILLDALNRTTEKLGQYHVGYYGDGTPLSEQLALIATLVIWGIGFASLIIYKLYKKAKTKSKLDRLAA